MHIVITRPKEDSLFLIERLQKLGHMVTYLPVIKIEELQTKKINLLDYKAVIFTSSNAMRNYDTKDFNKNTPCFCVGDATEKTAKQKGFHNTFTEDLVMLEAQQEIIDAHEGMPTVNINADKTTMPVRRMMDNLLKEQSLNSA